MKKTKINYLIVREYEYCSPIIYGRETLEKVREYLQENGTLNIRIIQVNIQQEMKADIVLLND